MINVPNGYIFIDQANAAKFLEWNQNIPDGDELGIIMPVEENWFIIWSFQNVGYVKDDEKANLDADALLQSMKEATEAANQERRKRGWGTMTVVGWHARPYFADDSKNLEWGIIGQNENGNKSINHNSRFLGRRGVMSANLVSSPERIGASLAAFRTLSSGFSYNPENRYTSFVKGDKVAEYGLSALILGGATAAAAKTGLLKTLAKMAAAFWKLIVVALIGLGSAVVKLFRRRETHADSNSVDVS